LRPALPFKWTKKNVTLGRQTFPSNESFPAMIYPNPLNPAKYVVLNTGLTIEDRGRLRHAALGRRRHRQGKARRRRTLAVAKIVHDRKRGLRPPLPNRNRSGRFVGLPMPASAIQP